MIRRHKRWASIEAALVSATTILGLLIQRIGFSGLRLQRAVLVTVAT